MDSVGNVAALEPGSTFIVVRGGREADTLSLVVGEVVLPTSQLLQYNLTPQSDYVTDSQFLSTLSNQAQAVELKEAVELLIGEMLAGHGPKAVGQFEAAQRLWEEYGEGTELKYLDGPQLDVIAIALMHAADALGIVDFLR